ncbi:MAG: TRAP transporter substrate-binding protein [Rhodobiaceae bacterium]|nr:TRAP transporter substrate-binding protein [Rhodobiaceae bacterium]MCC0056062.1 TRAP transporter substrate-binding protein [Rhodobiaceae bacterium]
MSLSKFAGFAVTCAMATAVFAGVATAEPVVLKYSRWLPVNYAMDRDVVIPWLMQFEKVTDGRVKVELTAKGVGTVAGQYDVVADGLADISFVVTGYTPGRFVAAEGLDLPFLGDDPTTRCPNFWNAYEKYLGPANIFKEVKILGVICTNPGHFAMTKQIITDIEQLQGMKIRTPGPTVADSITLLGAVPVSKPTPEIYELAAGGVIDGAIFPIDPIPAFKLDTVLKKITYIPGGVSGTTTIFPINKAKWDMISPEDQKAIMEISGAALAKSAGELSAKELEVATKTIKDGGGEIVVANDKLVADLKERLKPIRDEWIKRAKEAGLEDPEGMLALFGK